MQNLICDSEEDTKALTPDSNRQKRDIVWESEREIGRTKRDPDYAHKLCSTNSSARYQMGAWNIIECAWGSVFYVGTDTKVPVIRIWITLFRCSRFCSFSDIYPMRSIFKFKGSCHWTWQIFCFFCVSASFSFTKHKFPFMHNVDILFPSGGLKEILFFRSS